jgi:transposase
MDNRKTDLRKIPSEELKRVKIEAMELRDEGVSNKEVAEKFNLDPSVVSRWHGQYTKNFKQLRDPAKRGRKKGTQTSLTKHQEEMIIKTLRESSGLLEKQLVQNLIEEKYHMIVPISTVGDYLKKWGVNSSLIKGFEKDFINRVGEEEFQSICQVIKKQNGMIVWIQTMECELNDGAKLQSVFTRITNNKLVFKIYAQRIQAVDFIDFVNHVATFFTKHLYVIFDAENIECIDKEKCFINSEKITFIYRI